MCEKSLSDISKCMKQTAPVFIIGEARSGTSLLNRTLEYHSSFRPHKIRHIEAKVFLYTNASHTISPDYHCSLFKYMLADKNNFEQFIASITTIQTLHRRIGRYRYIKALSQKSISFYKLFMNHLIVRSFFYFAQKARACKRIIEKTPNNAPHIHKLKTSFPKSKFLYIHRHPVDVFSSYRKVAKREGPTSWANLTLNQFCDRYRYRTQKALGYKNSFSDDLLFIDYHGFVQNPRKTFEKICNFIQEPFELEPLEISERKNIRTDEQYITQKIAQRTKNWHDFLSVQEARILEQNLADFIDLFGYKCYT
jgi:hypothetical protein